MALGGRTVAEWQEVMSSDEFTDWLAYYELNPFGPKRGDYQAALIASTIANAHAAKGKSYGIKDFLLAFKSPFMPKPATMSGEQVLAVFAGMATRQKSGG